ncbi:bifunctional diguanylate cyclase/phosphodiesterase [Virgibacillus sp. DJP39]|uniref:bifunctional diguanylate cyclase/phosphodiesterase n=1 Tax=Virgibacillus sp. DJP39 TaxID=3409790 RepID=UPI003BB5A7D3
MKKYTGRIITILLTISILVGVNMYRFFKNSLEISDLIAVLVCIPISWWVGRLIDRSNRIQNESKQMVDNLDATIWVNDTIRKRITVSKGIEKIYGITAEEIYDDYDLWLNSIHKDDRNIADIFYSKLLSGKQSSCQFRVIHKDDQVRWVELRGTPIFDEQGNISKLYGITLDVSEQIHNQNKIEYLAYNDNLTSLPNRINFNLSLQNALDRSKHTNQKLAIMFMDLDRFKFVNDTMGHFNGDKLLIQVGKRLVEIVREGDIVARQGGDEFIILLEGIEQPEAAEIARQILQSFNNSFSLNGEHVFISPSIGISSYPKDGQNIDELTKSADTAMYLAKKLGKNKYQFYIHEDQDKIDRKVKIERGLKQALNNKEFELNYQPKVDLITGKIYGVEGLLRWNHPELGQISPIEFIPVAEEIGVIIPVGKWVIQEACKQNKLWQESGILIEMAVNVSSIQFEDNRFVESVKELISESQLSPNYLCLEITESNMLNITHTNSIIKELKNIGIKVAIDDFGTGYSSLSVLGTLAIDTIKIDKSFINEINMNPKTTSLVKTIIEMGNNLNFGVVAEGIENESQVMFLVENGCRYGQGYYYNRPLKKEKISKLLKNQQLKLLMD